MLRCGHCGIICDSYEDWLSHLVSEGHQSTLGISEVFGSHKDRDRNERSLLVFNVNPQTDPLLVVSHFAKEEPLGFVTDAYVHLFPSVKEEFYLIVFDQRKFVNRICGSQDRGGAQQVGSSVVHCQGKATLSEAEWKAKLDSSFFYRRHEHLRRVLADLGWEEQLKQFLSIVSLTGEGYQQREKLMEELESLIREDYEEATVSPFGSCTTWLADTNADLDVYVDALGNGGRTDLDLEKLLEIMDSVEKLLRRDYADKNVSRDVLFPISHLTHPSGLKVNVSFENCLALQNSRMIRLMTKLDYRVRPLLIFLRYWARFHKLIAPQHLTSYALMLMALVFLRKKKILPTVHQIQTVEGTRPYEVCGWNTTFCNNRELIPRQVRGLKCVKDAPSTDRNAQEIMQLAYGFFLEYSSFDFESQVVCPLVGECLPKDSFDSLYGKDLPKEMELLKANLATSWCTPFPTRKPMCIQDPFTLNINVTSGCNSPEIVCKFKAACLMAAEALKPFATVYDSADTEPILDLCCQPVTTTKQQEVMKMSSKKAEEENLVNMAYVIAEATTTTNEDENVDEFLRHNNDQATSTSPDDKSSSDALQSIKDFYKDIFNYKGFSSELEKKDRHDRTGSSRDSWSSDLNRQRDRERENPTRIQRISLFETSEEASLSGSGSYDHLPQSYPGYTVPTSPERIPGESTSKTNKDEKERSSGKKTMKSAVVVPNNSSSSNTGLGTVEKSSTPSASSTCSSYKIVSPKDKSLIDMVFRVENNQVKVKDSKGSAEPVVVKFVASSEPSPAHFQSFPTAQASSVSVSAYTPPGLQVSSKELTPNKPIAIVQYVSEVDVLPAQQIPPPEISTNFDSGNNYGYTILPKTPPFTPGTTASKPKNVKQAETPKTKSIEHYLPPKETEIEEGENNASSADVEVTPESPRSELNFPAFVVYLTEHFYQSVYSNLKTLSMFETLLLTKMKVLWTNTVVELFGEAHLWRKLKPIMEDGSFHSVRLEKDRITVIFEEVERTCSDFLTKATSAYIPNRKRPHPASSSSSDESIFVSDNEQGPSPKVRKTSTTGLPGQSVLMNSSPSMSHESRASLLSKLGRVPSNVRKRSSFAYFFRCHPSILTLLQERWETISSEMQTEYPGTSPLDMFGKICEQVKVTLVDVPPQDEWINVKMIVAFETTSDPPGLYFGFEFEHRLDDPTYDKQAGIHIALESILTDLIEAHVIYRMGKFFTSK